MKQLIANFVSVTGRMPVVMLLLFATCIAWAATACRCFLAKTDLWLVRLAAGENGRKLVDVIREQAPCDLSNIDEAISYLDTLEDDAVSRFRQLIEDSTWGRAVRKNASNKRIYAVLKPTREEDMLRIANVLFQMPYRVRKTIVPAFVKECKA